MRVVFLPTIQHTGTWFLIELLRNHTGIDYFIEAKDMFKEKLVYAQKGMLMQCHFGEGAQRHPGDGKEGKFFENPQVEQLLIKLNAIIPLRDPLLSLITRHKRHPELQHFYIINGFAVLTEWYERYGKEKLFCVPVDLYSTKSIGERFHLLESLFTFTFLSSSNIDYIRNVAWATRWPIFNSTGTEMPMDKLGQLYRNGDVKKIASFFPEEYEYLKSKEGILKPFLQELGYQNLPWWG